MRTCLSAAAATAASRCGMRQPGPTLSIAAHRYEVRLLSGARVLQGAVLLSETHETYSLDGVICVDGAYAR